MKRGVGSSELGVRKIKHLEFVLLTAEEFSKLCKKLGPDGAAVWIEQFDDYLGLSEKNRRKYDSHYRAILVWAKRSAIRNPKSAIRNDSADRFIADLREHRSWPDMAPKTRSVVYAVLSALGKSWPNMRAALIEDPALETKLRETFLAEMSTLPTPN